MLHKHSFIYLLGRVLPALVSLGATAIFTRMAAPDEYAVLVLTMATANIASAAFFQWLRQSFMRLAPALGREKLLATLFPLYLIQTLLVLIAMVIAFLITGSEGNSPWFWVLCAAMLLAQAWFDLNQDLQRSALEPLRFGLTFAARTIGGLVLGTVALYFTGDGFYLALAVALSFFLSPLAFARNQWRGVRPAFDRAIAREILKYGLPLGVAMLLGAAATACDKLIVAHFLTDTDVGTYGAAADLTRQTIYILMQSVALAAFPLTVRALETHGVEAAREQLVSNFNLLLLLALPACVGFVTLRHEIAAILLGPDFRAAATQLIPWLAAAAFLQSFIAFYFSQAAQLGRRTAIPIITASVIFCTALVSNTYFTQRYGLEGAAWSTVITQAIGISVSYVMGRFCFPLPVPWLTVVKGAAAVILMAAVLEVAKPLMQDAHDVLALGILITLGGAAYGAAALLLNAGECRMLAGKLLAKVRKR